MERDSGKQIEKYLLLIVLIIVATICFFNIKQPNKNTGKFTKTSSVKKEMICQKV
ncbi:hypothetical protein ACTL31_05190 [Leuconostoc mesenteroides]